MQIRRGTADTLVQRSNRLTHGGGVSLQGRVQEELCVQDPNTWFDKKDKDGDGTIDKVEFYPKWKGSEL